MPSAKDYLGKIKQSGNSHNAFRYVPYSVKEAKSDLTIAVKDNILVAGEPAGAASKMLEGFVAPYDATAIKRLRRAGAAFVARTNMDEFAMGSSTENSAYGVAINPWGDNLVPGGSSGGSAIAVALEMCDAALGSDTAGSIRTPASFCGVTGLKPTYGSVSRYGLIAMASSFDVIGPFARKAEDLEKVFAIISGQDEYDQTTIKYEYEPTSIDFRQLKVGLPKELWAMDVVNGEITTAVQSFVDWLRAKGANISTVSLPSIKYALPAYYIITPAEVSANLARFDGIRYRASVPGDSLLDVYKNSRALLGPEVKRRILIGTYVLSVGHYDDYYAKAVRVRLQIKADYDRVFENVDVLVSATMPMLPFKLGEKMDDPLAMYKADLLTVSANLAGVPALSLPIGFSQNNLPIGGQLTSQRSHDNLLIALAKAYQAETEHHTRKPADYGQK